MFHESFRTLFWREFKSIKQGADYFHVTYGFGDLLRIVNYQYKLFILE